MKVGAEPGEGNCVAGISPNDMQMVSNEEGCA